MKRFLILFILVSLSCISVGQNAYYDAILLKQLIDTDTTGTVSFTYNSVSIVKASVILAPYIDLQIRPKDPKLILAFFEGENSPGKNPFLKKYIDITGDEGLENLPDLKDIQRSDFKSIGGLNVTNIADGLARFIVNRAKSELNAYFFTQFQTKIKESEELQSLFPETAHLLVAIGEKVYNYNAYLTSLRGAFESDLAGLYVNFPKLMDTDKYIKVFSDFPELRVVLKSSFYIIDQMNNGVHPAEILHQFPPNFKADVMPLNIYSSMKLMDLFSQSFHSKMAESTKNYWLSMDSIQLLLNDEITFRIYLGLVYQQTDSNIVFQYKQGSDTVDLVFKNKLKELGEKWDIEKDKYLEYKTFISQMSRKFDHVSTSLRAVNPKEKPDFNQIYAFTSATLDMFEYAQKVFELPYLESINAQNALSDYGKYMYVAKNVNGLYKGIHERNYGTAVFNAAMILDTIYNDKVIQILAQNELVKQEAVIWSKNEGNTSKIERKIRNLDSVDDVKKEVSKFKKIFVKYGSFMASVVEANSSAEVEAAIESVAMPPGSYSVKRQAKCNISVNAYLGGFVGHEWIKGVEETQPINNLAVSAPVGLAFSSSFYLTKKNKHARSFSLFISVIDLGALASFRIGDDSTAVVSEIKLENIVAPGFGLNYNFNNSPFTLGTLVQFTPLLRAVNRDEAHELKNSSWRWGVTLTVDIPLFNLRTRERE